MSKTVFVGDLHAQMSNFEDTKAILKLVLSTVKANKKEIDSVIFLGDMFHTHSVVRQEVGFFIKEEIEILSNYCEVVILAGNHDGSSPHSVQLNSVRLLLGGMKNVIIIDDENDISGYKDFLILPFMGNQQKMIDLCQDRHSDAILICHQTFDGAAYENKMLAPGGIKQELIPQRKIISGHIHTEQQVGKVFYPGTPRALTANEVNQEKGIFVFDRETESFQKIPTNHLVKTFIAFDVKETGTPDYIDQEVHIPITWKEKDDVRINVYGSEEFYKKVIDANAHLEGKARFIPNIRRHLSNTLDIQDSTSSIEEAFSTYVKEIYNASDELKESIWNKMAVMAKKTGNSRFF